MTRLELVIGNWMLDKAKGQGFNGDPAEIYAEGIQLADQVKKFFEVKER